MDTAKTIFISHATPTDNQFTLWLALRLMSLGYDVWCDLLNLSKGGDFWSEIEAQIRTHTCKFLLVQSKVSNTSEGVLKEIAVAQKVKKARNDANFVIPLKIDETLSFDDISVDVIRLNSIDFTKSWAIGFAELTKALIDQNCPKESKEDYLSIVIERMTNPNQSPVGKEELYDSNWFSIQNLPEYLNFYPLINANDTLPNLPVLAYKNHLVTFWSMEGLPQKLKARIQQLSAGYSLRVSDYLHNENKTDFIWSSIYRKLYVGVLAKVFDYSLQMRPKIKCYIKSMRKSFWYQQGSIEKDRVGRIQLVGKHQKYHWHFAISGNIKLFPAPLLQIQSHVLFSKNGKDLVTSDAFQHRARRSLGKGWWNKEWRTRLLAFVRSLESETLKDTFVLTTGVEEAIRVSCTPIQFVSNVTYVEPGHEAEKELDDYAGEDSAISDKEEFEVCTR